MRKLVLFILMSISIFGYSQSQKISQLGRETTLTDSSLFLIGKWNSVNNFSSKAINVANLKTVLGGTVVDSGYVKTTGKTYQHDSLYVDKLFVQSTGVINSNVFTVPTTSATNGINWSGMGVSIKSPSSTMLGFYSGANQTFAVASSYVSVAGNIFAAINNSYDLGTSATAFRSIYSHNMYLRSIPTLDNANDVVLVRNATTGKIDYRSAATLTPSLTTNYIGYGSGGNTVTGSPDFTWNNTAKELYANGKGYFGGVNGVARLNITASGTGGTSKIFSGYDLLNSEKFYILDNGDISSRNIKTTNSNVSLGNNASPVFGGYYGVFIGEESAYSLTTGNNHIVIGTQAMHSNISGVNNTIVGHQSGYYLTSGNNTLYGIQSGFNITTGAVNTFFGAYAGLGAGLGITGSYNVACGANTLQTLTSGTGNTILGHQSGYTITSGGYNFYGGFEAGRNMTTGSFNIGIGAYSLNSATESTGSHNIAFGYNCGMSLTTGYGNILLARSVAASLTTGFHNIMIGDESGHDNVTGQKNIFLGFNSGYYETGSNKLYISNSSTLTPLIYGEFDNQLLRVNGRLDVINSAWLGGTNGVARLNITTSASDGSSKGLSIYNQLGVEKAYILDNGNTTIGNILKITPQTSTEGSAITPSDGMIIYVSDTNATFTSVGIWARENGVWVKL